MYVVNDIVRVLYSASVGQWQFVHCILHDWYPCCLTHSSMCDSLSIRDYTIGVNMAVFFAYSDMCDRLSIWDYIIGFSLAILYT